MVAHPSSLCLFCFCLLSFLLFLSFFSWQEEVQSQRRACASLGPQLSAAPAVCEKDFVPPSVRARCIQNSQASSPPDQIPRHAAFQSELLPSGQRGLDLRTTARTNSMLCTVGLTVGSLFSLFSLLPSFFLSFSFFPCVCCLSPGL